MNNLFFFLLFFILWIIAGYTTNKMYFKDNDWIHIDEKIANFITGIPGLLFYISKYKILKKNNF